MLLYWLEKVGDLINMKLKKNKTNNWDNILKIKTSGFDNTNADQYHYPYQPTDYCILERLASSGYFGKKNVLLDYGCGKGRVEFFMSYQCKCKAIGIEYDQRIFDVAADNYETAISSKRVELNFGNAEEFKVPSNVDRCFFFNPFSVEILQKVMARIIESYYNSPGEILLFFYYPSEEYISYLMTEQHVEFLDEIECFDLYDVDDDRERIMIFKIV